jgi:hypothetical protein
VTHPVDLSEGSFSEVSFDLVGLTNSFATLEDAHCALTPSLSFPSTSARHGGGKQDIKHPHARRTHRRAVAFIAIALSGEYIPDGASSGYACQ